MNVFTVIGIVGVSMVLMTGLLAYATYNLSNAVVQNNEEIEQQKTRYNQNATLGFKIAQDQDSTTRFKDARQEAAKRAASLPRGANMRIGHKGGANAGTASENLNNDPISAYKIAEQQGWQGIGEFSKMQEAALGGGAVAPTTVVKRVRRKLVPGKDFAITAITDAMSLEEKRKTRVANAKAKYEAMKKLKESGDLYTDDAPVVEQVAGTPAVAAPAAAAPSAAAAAGIPEPTLIELTDDMSPEEKRNARISNSKAKSAYKKALKAAGIDPKAAKAAPAPAAPVEVAPAATAVPSNIPKPELVELTDDMSPEEKRNARISNSKAKSAYKKALKAAGIDPKTVKL